MKCFVFAICVNQSFKAARGNFENSKRYKLNLNIYKSDKVTSVNSAGGFFMTMLPPQIKNLPRCHIANTSAQSQSVLWSAVHAVPQVD